MRMKRTVAAALCALMICALCLTVLPRRAMAISHVTIGGLALSAGTPYYKDGGTSGSDPGGWTAHFTSNALQLRNLGQTGITDIGIQVFSADPTPFYVQLEGASFFKLSALSTDSAITGITLVFTGNGALSVASNDTAGGGYGIEANAIVLQYPATLTAAGQTLATSARIDTADWSKYTIKADTDMSGTNAATITEAVYKANVGSYKYVSFTAIPQPGPVPVPAGDLGADVPKTGDGAPLGLLASLALLSGAGLTVSAAGKRRAAKRR